MRSVLLATVAGFGLAFAGPAMAQHAPHPRSGGSWHGGGQWHGAPGDRWHRSGGYARQHWGGSIGGRWIGGARAPGGWNAYRRPVRGWAVPGYWLAPSFTVADWGAYGLAPPPAGYRWSRYYDDAVLIDPYGRAMDCVEGVDWDGDFPDGYADHGDYDYDMSHDVGPGAPYAPPPPGMLPPPPPPPGARVETRTYAYEGAPPVVVHGGPDCGCEGTVVGGWYYPPATTTTVTISSVPVTTTTTRTEYIEEAPVVYRTKIIKRAAPRAPSKIVRRYHTKVIKR